MLIKLALFASLSLGAAGKTAFCDFGSSSLTYADSPSQFRQTSSSLAMLKPPFSQTFVSVWQSNAQDSSGLGIFAKIFTLNSSSITPMADLFQVNTGTLFDQQGASVESFPGGFAIVFESTVLVAGNIAYPRQERILMQLYDNYGKKLGGELHVSEQEYDRRELDAKIVLTFDATNAPILVVSWASVKITSDNAPSSVFVRRFSVRGEGLSSSLLVNQNGDSASTQSIASLKGAAPQGSFMVVWTSQTLTSCSQNVVAAKMFKADGKPVTPQFQVNSFSPNDAYEPFVESLADGSFVVSWTSNAVSATPNVYARYFDQLGRPRSQEFAVNTFKNDVQSGSFIVERPQGGCLMLWNSFGQTGSDFAIFGRFFDVNMTAIGEEFLASDGKAGSKTLPSAIAFPDGQTVISWTEGSQLIALRRLQCQRPCIMNSWSNWSNCSHKCGPGTKTRTRTVLLPAKNGGASCGAMTDSTPCNNGDCIDPICRSCNKKSCFVLKQDQLPWDQASANCHKSYCKKSNSSNCMLKISEQDERAFILEQFYLGEAAWIDSWKSTKSGNASCLSMSTFGAITVNSECLVKKPFICQIARPAACPLQ